MNRINLVCKFKSRYQCFVLVYLFFGVVLTLYLCKGGFSLNVLTNYKNRESAHSRYPDEQLGSLHRLVEEDLFENKRVAMWRIDTASHDDTFSLKLAYTYFKPLAAPIIDISDAKDIQHFDFILSPWEEDYLEDFGTELIHDENWLFVYKVTESPNEQSVK